MSRIQPRTGVRPKKRKAGKTILQKITIVLLIVLAVAILILFMKLADDHLNDYAYEYTDFARSLKSKDYPEIADMARYNEEHQAKAEEDTSEFLFFARYFEASQLYHAYSDTGNEEKADQQMMIMQENYRQLSNEEIIQAADDLQTEMAES